MFIENNISNNTQQNKQETRKSIEEKLFNYLDKILDVTQNDINRLSFCFYQVIVRFNMEEDQEISDKYIKILEKQLAQIDTKKLNASQLEEFNIIKNDMLKFALNIKN